MIGENDVLKPTGDSSNLDEGYVYVTVKYNNYEGQSSPTGDNKTVTATVKLDFVQSNSDAAPVEPTPATFTGTIYRNNTTGAGIGDSIVPVSGTKYIVTDGQYENLSYGPYETLEECQEDLSNSGEEVGMLSCQQKTGTFGGVGEYTTDASTLDKSNYLKHDVVDDIITATYTCFVINNTEYCMKGSTDGSTFNANKSLLGTLKDAGMITCSTFNDYVAVCSGSGFDSLSADSDGHVAAQQSSIGCAFDSSSNNSSCIDMQNLPLPGPGPSVPIN